MAGWIKTPLGTEVNLGRGDVVLDGVAAAPFKSSIVPPFSAHVYCCQTAGWMQTPLGTEVDLCPGHIVLDEDPAPRQRGTAAPSYGPCLLWQRSPISATVELLFGLPSIREERENRLFVRLSVSALEGKERKGKEDGIYLAPLSTHAYSQSAQAFFTQHYLQTTPCLPFLPIKLPKFR